MKVYVLRYRSYEIDDVIQGGYHPIFISLDKKKVEDFFKERKKEVLDNFYKLSKESINIHEDVINYEIVKNTNKELWLFQDNWCYRYRLDEYELDKEINQIWM